LQQLLIDRYYKKVGVFCKAKGRHEFHELALMKREKNCSREGAKENK
jgi:hypothetical protein